MFFGLLPAALYTHHQAEGDGTGPSGRIMASIAAAANNPDGSLRLFSAFEDDFAAYVSQAAATAALPAVGGSFFADTGGTLASSATDLGGLWNLVTSTTENHEAWIKGGGNVQLDANQLFFEARVTLPIATGACFVGLGPAGAAGADELVDATPWALKDGAFFGFYKTAAGILEFRMNKASGAETVIATAIGPGTSGAVTGTHSLGFIYSSRSSSSHEKLEIYVDNELKGTYTGAQFAALLTADYPLSVPMSFTAGCKNTTAAANTVALDWAYCYSQID